MDLRRPGCGAAWHRVRSDSLPGCPIRRYAFCQFAHELINAMPYAYLDEADAEARRARATTLRKGLPLSVSEDAGRLDQAAIDTVRAELWPDLRDEQ